jgi:hypothetical protein
MDDDVLQQIGLRYKGSSYGKVEKNGEGLLIELSNLEQMSLNKDDVLRQSEEQYNRGTYEKIGKS